MNIEESQRCRAKIALIKFAITMIIVVVVMPIAAVYFLGGDCSP